MEQTDNSRDILIYLGLNEDEIITNNEILQTLKTDIAYIDDYTPQYNYVLGLLRKYSKNDSLILENMLLNIDLGLVVNKINGFQVLKLLISKNISYLDNEIETLVLLSKDLYVLLKNVNGYSN